MPHPPIDGGYQIWARQTLESDIFLDKPAEWFKLWFYLVMSVHWSDDERLPRGATHITYRHTADMLHLTRNQIDSFFRYAKKAKMVSTKKTTRGMIVSLLSYEKYQDPKNYKTDTKSQPRGSRIASMKVADTETDTQEAIKDHNKAEKITQDKKQTDTKNEMKPTRNRHATDTIEEERKKGRKEEGDPTEGEAKNAASPPRTPGDEAREFFENPEKQEAIISWLLSRGVSPEAARKELEAFILCWTEPNKSGKRLRWELQDTFEIKRRLVTWFKRASRDGQRGGVKPSQQWHVAQ